MMELVQRAIPVIQHPPVVSGPGVLTSPQIRSEDAAAASPADEPVADRRRNSDAADETALAAHMDRTLERFRTGQALLLSGAILQQYRRLVVDEVVDTRPTTRALDVRG